MDVLFIPLQSRRRVYGRKTVSPKQLLYRFRKHRERLRDMLKGIYRSTRIIRLTFSGRPREFDLDTDGMPLNGLRPDAGQTRRLRRRAFRSTTGVCLFFFGPEKRTRLYVLFSITARRDQGVKYANAVKTVRRKLFALRPFVVRDARPIPYDYRAIPI